MIWPGIWSYFATEECSNGARYQYEKMIWNLFPVSQDDYAYLAFCSNSRLKLYSFQSHVFTKRGIAQRGSCKQSREIYLPSNET
jgi:hypothetical protein